MAGEELNPVDEVNSGADSGQVCRHHLQGKCTFGDKCRFPHADPAGGLNSGDSGLNNGDRGLNNGGSGVKNGGGRPATSGQVCRHFLEGRCDRGAECRFSHEGSINYDRPIPSSVLPSHGPSGTICRHFLAGKCDRPNDCRFSHDVEGQPGQHWPEQPIQGHHPAFAPFPGEPKGKGANICRHFLIGKCDRGSECRFPHDDPGQGAQPHYPAPQHHYPAPQHHYPAPQPHYPAPVDNRKICRHFLEGRCDRGDVCNFSHAAAPGHPYDPYAAPPQWHMAPPAPMYQQYHGPPAHHGPAAYHGPPPAAGPHDGKGDCRHFLMGRCEKGGQCRFAHPGFGEYAPPAPSYNGKGGGGGGKGGAKGGGQGGGKGGGKGSICRHFLEGRCDRGDECRFPHDDSASPRFQPY